MAHDEARPQSNEADPVKPAQGLESAHSSPAPVLPTDATAPKAVPRTEEVSPPLAEEPATTTALSPPADAGVPPRVVDDTITPAAVPTAPASAAPPDVSAEPPRASQAAAPVSDENTAAAPGTSIEGTPVPSPTPADSGSHPPAPDTTSAPTGDDFHSGEHGQDEYHHDPYHDYHAGEGSPGHGGGHTGGEPPPDAPDPLFAPDEEGGGPVKTFLEHLEDFRWVIIKCAASIMVMMTLCLLGANYLVDVLKWPLKRASHIIGDQRQYISVELGPKQVAYFRTTNSAAIPGFLLATNKYVEIEFAPVTVTNLTSTNILLGLRIRRVSDELPPDRELPLVYKGPADPFIASLKIAFFGGLLLALPVVLFHILQFVFPALKPRELKYLKKAIYPATVLFVTGLCLCYFLIMPIALKAAEKYSRWMGVEMLFWHADDYFSFCTKFMLGMGLGFEMPVLLLALVKIGLLDYKKLSGFRRYMILINLVLGALLTTPEVLTQVLMFVPLQFLYEVTIWIAWYWEQEDRVKTRKRAAMVVGGAIIAIELIWLLIQLGWPLLREAMK